MNTNRLRVLALATLVSATALDIESAHAAMVTFTPVDVSGTTWEYDYTVTNNTLSSAIQEFTVYFPVGQYESLTNPVTPSDWNGIVVQPDAALPAAGFFDAQALGTGVAPGQTVSGFSAQFTWLGAGAPGPQAFDIVDPNTFATIESGTTVSAVPLPNSLLLLLSALSSVAIARIMARSDRARHCDVPQLQA